MTTKCKMCGDTGVVDVFSDVEEDNGPHDCIMCGQWLVQKVFPVSEGTAPVPGCVGVMLVFDSYGEAEAAAGGAGLIRLPEPEKN